VKKKLLLSSLLLLSTLYGSNVDSNMERSDGGWYVGLNLGLTNFGGSLERSDGDKTYKFNEDVDSRPFMLKAGYLQSNDNRLEFYYKKDNMDIKGHEVFSSSTIGIKSEWGISSLSQNRLLPYFTLGFGVGTSSSSQAIYDDGIVLELDIGLGIHYQVHKNIDATIGLFRRSMMNIVSGVDTGSYYYEDSEDYSSLASVNGIEIGVSYYF